MIKLQDLINSAIIIILLSHISLFIGILIVIIREYRKECEKRTIWV